MSKLFIVTIYKRNLLDCPTYVSLVRLSPMLTSIDKIIFWDNSPEPTPKQNIDEACWKLSNAVIEYVNTPGNLALSNIYNRCISMNAQYDLVILLDQDSTFDKSYYKELERAVIAEPHIKLFVPLIVHDDLIVSPGNFNGFKGKYWKKSKYGQVEARGNMAITSGMAIRMSYFEEFGKFEERLKLYGIDTNFSIRYGRQNQYFFVLMSPFDHDLSDFNEETVAVRLRRFQDFSRASLINAELFPFHTRLLTRLFLLYKSMVNAIKYKKWAFIKFW